MLVTAQPTFFLIADISGYTTYLGGVELDHAQEILADLIGSIVSSLGPGFALAKLEGDATFVHDLDSGVGVSVASQASNGANMFGQ